MGRVIHDFKDSEDFDGHFDYRKVVGKLLYLDKSSRSDISYATHVLARYTSAPKKEHGEMVKWLGRYLAGTRDKGAIYTPTYTHRINSGSVYRQETSQLTW